MSRKPYPSDLTDAEWSILEPLIPPAKPGGHPRTQNMREVISINGPSYRMKERQTDRMVSPEAALSATGGKSTGVR